MPIRLLLLSLVGMLAVAPTVAKSQSAAAKSSKNTKAPSAATLANYKTHCQPCHLDGNAPQALMNFADGDWRYGSTLKEVTKNIADGVRGTPMEGFKDRLTGTAIDDLARYVRSFDPKLK
jgi:mono/diheme cytochrome c family protein